MQRKPTVSICTDMTALRGDLPERLRNTILKRGGGRRSYSEDGNSSVTCLSRTDGLEALAGREYIVLTDWETIFGWTDADGVEHPRDEALHTLYTSIYPHGILSVPSGYSVEHING